MVVAARSIEDLRVKEGSDDIKGRQREAWRSSATSTTRTPTTSPSPSPRPPRRRAGRRVGRGSRQPAPLLPLARVTYKFVDCRWELGNPARGRELYLEGHVPGASFLDVDVDLSAPPGKRGRHPLPEANDFARAVARAGIGNGVFVVAYGNMGGAERLWWLLRHFGHDDCAVMDVEGWHGPLAVGEETIEPAELLLRDRHDDTIEADELAQRRDELVVVDARLPERWRGEPNPLDKKPGRSPGALTAPWNAPSAK